MQFFYDFLIDDKPILSPDAGVTISLADLDSDDSGRDESGFMHRVVLREGVKTWGLSYSFLTAEEYLYVTGLFKGKSMFTVTYRDVDGSKATCTAYCAKHSIVYQNARTGLYKNLKFNIIEC